MYVCTLSLVDNAENHYSIQATSTNHIGEDICQSSPSQPADEAFLMYLNLTPCLVGTEKISFLN